MAKVIMVQGTMSNVGKSWITAGLCRMFMKDGYKVAPFKSQNMALNSYVTRDGLEMGRAQAVQAECCNRVPDVRMNPILLKPSTDMGSQVIVNGKPVANMSAREYFQYKTALIPVIRQAFDELEQENDIIVIEGAGSPAELNLKKNDIVNMGLAAMVNAPVLLVGDINPGGIFAQLYGTVALLEEEERARIKALVINKFRGDKSILLPGIAILEEKCRVPVAGVVPYMRLDLEEEDSQSARLESGDGPGVLHIAVVRFPRMSNYTDFMPLEAYASVRVEYITRPEELENKDMIILPGSKSTMADLRWLKQTGIGERIQRLHKSGVMVCGICGGYQMMGQRITDDVMAEGRGETAGLGLLPVETDFENEKQTRQTQGRIIRQGMFAALSDNKVEGYEIHMGRSRLLSAAQAMIQCEDMEEGCVMGNAFGTYFHGIFENDGFTEYVLSLLCEKKGLKSCNLHGSYHDYKLSQYDCLEKLMRENINTGQIYDILWKGM